MTTLYAQFLAAGCEIDHHESDLYVKVTPEAQAVLKAWNADPSRQVRTPTFISQIDGQHWYDIAFMYAPFWERVRRSADLCKGIA